MTTDDEVLHLCPWCKKAFLLATGCDATEAAHTTPHDGHGCDQPCRDCSAHPGEQHHPGCCVADCGDNGQAMLCGCQWCDPVNEELWIDAQTHEIGEHPIWRELEP